MSNKVNTLKAVEYRISPEQITEAISSSVRGIDSICDVLRSVDVSDLPEDTVCNLMILQQEKLEEIKDLLKEKVES
jgi:nitrogen regulatory protein PII-like uncharacterized protein